MPVFLQKFAHAGWAIALLGILSCQPNPTPATSSVPTAPIPPDVAYGALFHEVQMARVFPDGKTFADCTPRFPVADILKKYETTRVQPDFDLKKFVIENFDPPVAHSSGFKSDTSRTPGEHIQALWPVLTRQADAASAGTLLPLPHPYVVPGGRFGEVYYWDSYFTMLGLQAAGRRDLIEHMVSNFAYLIDTYGHIPNGNRSYYLSRSQPPFFSLMVQLLDDMETQAQVPPDQRALARFLPHLEKEYQFWMDGATGLSAPKPAHRRVVRLPDGTVLNRYFDDLPAPRPESYREDVETAATAFAADRPKADTYLDIKAGAESGWDFSSRWGVGTDLQGIATTSIAPIDLNCLMWHLERTLAFGFERKKDATQQRRYEQLAAARKAAIERLFFNPDPRQPYFEDVRWATGERTGVVSVAGAYPLFFGIASEAAGQQSCATLLKTLLRPGGLVCTPNHTGQQWDAPNGWAPLQWVGIVGLRRYGLEAEANDLKNRWTKLNSDVYRRTGKMLEKYNVENLSLEAGGGE
jgi:alpha,alpha-trehalase